jgi:hypothetical protein
MRKPIHIICVQGLSNGQVIDMAGPMTDDFTGEAIAPVTKAMPVPPSAQSVIDAKNVAKAEANHRLLQSVGILPVAMPQAPKAQGPRLRITLQRKEWRRI